MIQTLKYWKVFEIFWSKVNQNAISDLQTKFQLIVTSSFWNFHEKCLESVLGRKSHFWATFDSNFKILKSFRIFLLKSTSECYFWIAEKFELILTSTFWNFHEKCLESVLGGKSHFYATKIKILKSFRNFLVKSTSECYFWLANKVSTDSNEYFLKFSWKVFRINFRPKKSLLGHFWFKL